MWRRRAAESSLLQKPGRSQRVTGETDSGSDSALLVRELAAGRGGRRVLVLVAVIDASARDVVWGDFEAHAVAGEDADAVLPHPAARIGEHVGAVFQLDAELRIGQHFLHGAVDFQHFFLGHGNNLSHAAGGRERIERLKRKTTTEAN